MPVPAFAVPCPRNLRRCFLCIRRRLAGAAGILFSADADDRCPRCDLQWQNMQGLLGLRLRRDVLPAMFDVAVAAAVLFADGLQEPAAAKGRQKGCHEGRQMNTSAAFGRCGVSCRLSLRSECLQASGLVTAAPRASAGSEPQKSTGPVQYSVISHAARPATHSAKLAWTAQ